MIAIKRDFSNNVSGQLNMVETERNVIYDVFINKLYVTDFCRPKAKTSVILDYISELSNKREIMSFKNKKKNGVIVNFNLK